jgi:hypothetical protein
MSFVTTKIVRIAAVRLVGGEQLRFDVLKCFELERIAGGIEEEHRGLFAGLTLEARVRLDDEFDAVAPDPFGQFGPLSRPQHHATVRYRNTLSVDRVEMAGQSTVQTQSGIQMADELMAIEIEVDPLRAAAAFPATENVAVESAGFGDVAYLKGNVEGC